MLVDRLEVLHGACGIFELSLKPQTEVALTPESKDPFISKRGNEA